MGMFTQLSHNGQLYQFKTGFDDLRIYRVGDTIPWEPDPRYPGQHIDGVYDTIGPDLEDGPLVVICGRQITNVVQRLPGDTAEQIAADYRIEPPPRELWSELAWAEKAAREAQAELAYQRYLAENPGGNRHNFYARSLLKQRSCAQQILPVVKDPQHTPGPWQVIQVPGNSRLTIHGEVYDVATTCHGGSPEAEQANARLIAAAPELLEQLADTFDPDKQVIYEFARPLIEQARATIKKARGE